MGRGEYGMKMDMVKFTKKDVREYLETTIRFWRNYRDNAVNRDHKVMATYYVDAYQSVHMSLFGKTMELEGK